MTAEGGAGKLDGLKDLIAVAGGSLQPALPKKLADPQRCLVGASALLGRLAVPAFLRGGPVDKIACRPLHQRHAVKNAAGVSCHEAWNCSRRCCFTRVRR